MGIGWRRAFCKTVPRNKEPKHNHNHNTNQQEEPHIHQSSSLRQIKTGGKLRIFSSISNPSSPRFSSPPETTTPDLLCRAASEPQYADNTHRLQCRTSEKKSQGPRRKFASNPSSPRSPFSILKNTLRISKNGCGVCLQSAKTGRGMAIYTAECSHSFHFPCIAQHVRKQGSMICCPVCNVTWKDVPLLSAHKSVSDQDDVVEKTITTTTTTTSSPSVSAVKTNHNRSDDGISNQAFNDDEPLVSPAGAARFKPIPEAEDEFNEEANEQVGEFKGFFVNSTPTKKVNSSNFFHDRRTQRNVEFKILPEAAVISIGRSHETFAVALRVKAPLPPPHSADGGGNTASALSPSNRAPIDLVTVLDIGGSMTSAKLHMLKRAMRLVISSLGSSDRLSIVTFSSDPQRLLPLRRMTPQGHRLARRIVDQLSIGQGKSLSTAMRIAAKVLEDRREKNPVASIILLSDGKEESSQNGTVNQRQPTSHVSTNSTRFGHIEIPVHTYGFGGYNHQSIADALAKRVGGLLSVVVQDLRVQLGFSSGSSPCEITAVYSCNGRPSSLSCDSIRLGDLYAEEERELLVELRVPTSAIGSHHVMSVRCSYKDPSNGEIMYGRERALLVPRPHAVRSSDPRIERMRNVFVATRAVAETRRMAEYGEFGSAQRLLVAARALVAQSGSASAEEYVRWLEGELSELNWRRQCQVHQRQQEPMVLQQQRHHQHVEFVDENGEPLTPTSAWGAAERLAKVAMMKKSLNRGGDLHGFENARF